MPDIHAFDQEKNIFRDIGGVVGDALQIVRDENQIERGANRIFATIGLGQQIPIDVVLEFIHFIVGDQNRLAISSSRCTNASRLRRTID